MPGLDVALAEFGREALQQANLLVGELDSALPLAEYLPIFQFGMR